MNIFLGFSSPFKEIFLYLYNYMYEKVNSEKY